MIRRAAICAAALAVLPLVAKGDDAEGETKPEDGAKVTGDVRAGWRFLSGEDEGRFQQDWALTEGAKLFAMNLMAVDPDAHSGFDEAEVHIAGLGDPATDVALALRKSGVFELEGSWRRDDLGYAATGDPFEYDTQRERTSVSGLWTPNKQFALHVSWDRDQREGDAFTGAYYSFDGTSVRQHRLFETVSDRFALGFDWAVDVFRFGVTQTVGLTDVADKRQFDAPPGDTSAESTDRTVRAENYTTSARAGVWLAGGDLQSTVFMTRTRLPMEESMTGSQTDDSGTVTPTSGSGELTREALAWRWETLWRFHSDWELAVAAEREDVADDEEGQYLFGSFVQTAAFARVTDRTRRYSADISWDATDDVRFRVAEQYLHEELFVPTDSHFQVPPPDQALRNRPTDLQSDAWRTTAGADWKITKDLSFSALTRFTAEEEPQTTPLPEQSNEYSLRVRWKPADELALTTFARRTSASQSGAVRLYNLGHFPDTTRGEVPGQATELDSATRATSVAQSLAWTSGRWTLTATGSWRHFDTATDTAWGSTDNNLLTFDTVAFAGSDVTLSLDARYELTKTLRLLANGTRTNTTGDYTARWLVASLGAEYDIAEDVTLGATVQSWRFDEKHNGVDDYGVYGVELSLTYWLR